MTNKDKHKLYGILATVAFHAIAVVLLFNLCFRTPLPLPGEAGVEVNLGMYAEAMSQQDDDILSQQVEETESQQVEETTSQEIEDVAEDILSEDEEVPSIEEVEEEVVEEEVVEEVKEEIIEEVVEEVVEEKPVVNQRALFQVNKKKQETPSEGSSNDVVGEQGSPNGLKDIERYVGHGGSGDGPSYDLGGRGAKSISSPSKDISEEATIVVDIWVDKEGRVQRAEIGKGTTTTNSDMRASALQAARNSVFVKDDKAADLQKGTITYNFIIRQ